MCMTQMTVWDLQHHIGEHQEELARFALAAHLEETDDFIEDIPDLSHDEFVADNEQHPSDKEYGSMICHDCHNEWPEGLNRFCAECGSTATEAVSRFSLDEY